MGVFVLCGALLRTPLQGMRVTDDSVCSRLSHNTRSEWLSSSPVSCNSVNIRAVIERLVTVFDLLYPNYVGQGSIHEFYFIAY